MPIDAPKAPILIGIMPTLFRSSSPEACVLFEASRTAHSMRSMPLCYFGRLSRLDTRQCTQESPDIGSQIPAPRDSGPAWRLRESDDRAALLMPYPTHSPAWFRQIDRRASDTAFARRTHEKLTTERPSSDGWKDACEANDTAMGDLPIMKPRGWCCGKVKKGKSATASCTSISDALRVLSAYTHVCRSEFDEAHAPALAARPVDKHDNPGDGFLSRARQVRLLDQPGNLFAQSADHLIAVGHPVETSEKKHAIPTTGLTDITHSVVWHARNQIWCCVVVPPR